MSHPNCDKNIEPQHEANVPSHLDEPLSGPHPSMVKCPECGTPFKTHSELERHRTTIHKAGLHG